MADTSAAVQNRAKVFVHPGALHTEEDFSRIKDALAKGLEPIKSGFTELTGSGFADSNYKPNAQAYIIRGNPSWGKDNYQYLFRDAAAAYALALRWKITGDESYAIASAGVLDDWSSKLGGIDGTSDKFLASGLYGYQLANAGEILRGYESWTGLKALQDMLLNVFYQMNHDFLTNHNGYGASGGHYWANWDLAQICSVISIAVLCDRQDLFEEAVNYVKTGQGMGAFKNAVVHVYPDGLGQIQESGRDQGHAGLDIALMGIIAQVAFNQGEDLFAFEDNILLKGAEYVAKYNLGFDVPWTDYTNADGLTMTAISSIGRPNIRPAWELLYNHYSKIKGINAPYCEQFAAKVRPEGGGGKYGSNSGGFDQLGYGTLMYTIT